MGVGESAQEGRTQDLLTQDDAEQWRKGHAPTAKIVSPDSFRESFVLAACPPQGRVPVVCAHTQTERRDTQEATLRTDRTLTMYLNTHRDRHLACSLLSVVVCTVRRGTVLSPVAQSQTDERPDWDSTRQKISKINEKCHISILCVEHPTSEHRNPTL